MSKLEYEYWFPTVIAYSYNKLNEAYRKELVEHCYNIEKKTKPGGSNWLTQSKPYNTLDTYDPLKDEKFFDLNSWIIDSANQFNKKKVTAKESWFNIYRDNNYQEFHYHPSSYLSAIYVLEDDNGTDIMFKQPYKDEIDGSINVTYKSEQGKLLLFRSYVEHAVIKKNVENRITLAYNFLQT